MRNILILGALAIVVATSAYAYTTGEWLCTSGACTLGATTTQSTQIIGGVESISVGASNDTFLFTVDSTDTVTLIGADASGATNLTLDTTGAGAIIVGSADVTAITVTSDGGSVVLDGTVVAPVALVELAVGALTANTVHLATAAADYVLPACATATGDWVTVIVRDISEVVSLVPASGDTIHAPGTTTVLGADDELDSAGSDDDDGDFITLVCAGATHWYATAMGFQWVDGGTS